jgi:hypothetical protein
MQQAPLCCCHFNVSLLLARDFNWIALRSASELRALRESGGSPSEIESDYSIFRADEKNNLRIAIATCHTEGRAQRRPVSEVFECSQERQFSPRS